MIYIIGDSHVSVFSGTDKTHDGLRHIQPEFGTCYTLKSGNLRSRVNRFEQRIPYFCPIKIGSNTAYNSYDKLPRIDQVISEYNITDKDYIFTCFGEIDIRNHIGFHADSNGYSFEEGIRICVDRYMETIFYLKNKGLKVGVYGSPPSSVGLGKPIDYGDVIFRNKMTIVFNEYLSEKCIENNIPFKDVSKYLMLEDGTTDERFIMDDIHLSQESMPFIINLFSDIIDEQTRD